MSGHDYLLRTKTYCELLRITRLFFVRDILLREDAKTLVRINAFIGEKRKGEGDSVRVCVMCTTIHAHKKQQPKERNATH